ncbi:TPA: hypothetical protein TX976_001580 [Streptococcus suis]|nr:hypothetical protein [Streptococcus suis]
MKQANSKLAALTLITTLAVTSVIGTKVHANGHAEPDQAVAGNYNPITNDYIKKNIGDRDPQNITLRAKFLENNNFKNRGITSIGKVEIPSKIPENSSWFWDLWNRFTTFVKGIFS